MITKKQTVLVADDDPRLLKLIQRNLEIANYRVVTVSDGPSVLRQAEAEEPDLYVLDIMMPGLDGREVTRRLREFSIAPVLMLTAKDTEDDKVAGLEAGADDYLTKPFHPKELLARIGVGRRIIAMHRQIEAKNLLLEQAAQTDHLTGIPNRRAVEEFASKQICGAARFKFPVSVVVADLDNFKFINDTYGHASGDKVLQHFAGILKGNIRSADACGRLGGDEFVLVLSHSDPKGIPILIERLRATLAGQDFGFDGEVVHVSATFGFAVFEFGQPKNFAQLLADADAVLYREKSKRRQPAAQ